MAGKYYDIISRIKTGSGKIAIFHLICALAVAVSIFMFDMSVGIMLTKKIACIMCLAEGILLGSPVWVLRGRWRLIVPVCVALVSLFLWSNLMYYRYWNDLLPLSLIGETASYNPIVFRTLPGLARVSDIIFVLLPSAAFAAYRFLRICKAAAPSFGRGALAVLLSVIVYCGAHIVQSLSACRYWRSMGEDRKMSELLKSKLPGAEHFSREEIWTSGGMLLYLTDALVCDKVGAIELSDIQKEKVAAFMRRHAEIAGSAPDSVFIGNRDKNLIVIIVESLNSDYIGRRVSGKSITPVLDSLIEAPGTVSCLTMVSQVADGSSSDGQLMYNTGMLPLREGAVSMLFAGNKWYSLAEDSLFAQTGEIIVEKSGLWNHSATSKAYHFDTLIDNLNHDSVSMDEAALTRGLKMIAEARRPFFVQITTLSMHNPFDDPNTPDIAWIPKGSATDTERRYMLALHEFDRSLGNFIAQLKKSGLYDDSVVVIVSDHNIAVTESEKESGAVSPVAFIAFNTGKSMSISKTVGQIDVYPTIREIMARSYGWPGLGISILNPLNRSAVDAAGKIHSSSAPEIDSLKYKAWDISQLMVRSNYFSKP